MPLELVDIGCAADGPIPTLIESHAVSLLALIAKSCQAA